MGANALLRRAALDDIVVEAVERGFPVRRYIQDRTVIEDTESSIDLVARGWSLYNYPERLSYSATPPDFGSLAIQRRRWANGGLIILPKLMRHLVTQRPSVSWLGEGFMRFHYLTSIAAVNLGVLLILVYPIERYLLIAWLPLTALPYYVLYAWDLVLAGFSWTDVGRVYALNLLLIPVNLAGVFKSVQQMVLRNKIPFWRTPKIEGRTLAPTSIVAMQFALIGYCALGTLVDGWSGRWLNATFAAVNAAILVYAVNVFIGLRDSANQISRAAVTSPIVARVRRVLEFRRVANREDRS